MAAASRYWTSVRAGTAADQAWAQLLKDVGPKRAIWARQALTPTNSSGPPTFPDAATVDGNAGVAAAARALPSAFIVRVRYPGGETIVQGSAIPASLQVGISFGDAPARNAAGCAPVAATRRSCSTKDMRWMVDYDAALAVGMAVTVDLPPQTDFVQDVTAVGVAAGRGRRGPDRRARRVAPAERRGGVHSAGHADEQPRRLRERLLDHGGAAARAGRCARGRLRRRRARRGVEHRPDGTRADRRLPAAESSTRPT